MRKQIPLSKKVTDRQYVECITNAVIAELPEIYLNLNWEVEIFKDKSVNAFAMPGGKVGIYTGLFKTAKNQNQLAAVIGHEIAHVTLNHSLERANREMAKQSGLAIGQIIGISGDVIDAVAIGADIGLMMPYGRAQEGEADLLGLKYMASAGFDPRAAVQLWQNMSKVGGDSPPEFLSTHPSNSKRITDLSDLMPEAIAIYDQARRSKAPNCQR
ncbi:MAG: M48 family metallopeptidase [Pseudomonadota bacterium]|nr:M48 family metallopeptidase [Pseudomonadota bacterium]